MVHALKQRVKNSLENRSPAIDFLRGVAILTVVMLHFWMCYEPKVPFQELIFSFKFWPYLARNGYWGVSIFFVVSGYLITSSIFSRFKEIKNVSLRDFYVFRFARILPPVALLIFVNYILDLMIDERLFFYRGDLGFFEWLEYIFILKPNNYWTAAGIYSGFSLGVMWSLLVEEAFYVAYPLVCLVTRNLKMLSIFLVGIIGYSYYYRSQANQYDAMFTYMGCFDLLALGCLVAIIKNQFPKTCKIFENKRVLYSSLVFMSAVYISWHCITVPTWGSLLIGLGAAFFILAAATSNIVQYSGFFGTTIRIMGLYCFEIYLSHIIVSQLFAKYLFYPFDQISRFRGMVDVYFLMTLSTTIFVSILFSEFYSEPLRRFLKNSFLLNSKNRAPRDTIKTKVS
jgi:peptidoglycan/LPS O-acetylase OafA/YrhL